MLSLDSFILLLVIQFSSLTCSLQVLKMRNNEKSGSGIYWGVTWSLWIHNTRRQYSELWRAVLRSVSDAGPPSSARSSLTLTLGGQHTT